MFINKNKLEHLLPPEAYFDEGHYQNEVTKLFLPSWHLVATEADLARHGDFLTLELFGKPLQVRNIDGEIYTFINICSHRHCLLTNEPKGNDPRFRCQYHGWEYCKTGCARMIPDGGCFRPFDRENARLKKVRTECCGSLVFISFNDEGPSLVEYLGPNYMIMQEAFGPTFSQVTKYEADYQANWKIILENSVESYHVPYLHTKTFKELPKETVSEHVLEEKYTKFTFQETRNFHSACQNWFVKRLGMPVTNVYTQTHIHPNVSFSTNDVHRTLHVIMPTSSTTCRHIAWVFGLKGRRTGLYPQFLGRALRLVVKYVANEVIQEDAIIFADVQKGLQSSPFKGVIGTREERVYVFQKYIQDQMTLPSER